MTEYEAAVNDRQDRDSRVAFAERLLLEAVRILGQLALRNATARLSNSETLTMQQELFEVLEQLNDVKDKYYGAKNV